MEVKFIVSDITMKTVQHTKLPPSVFAISKALFLLTCLLFSPPMDLSALSDPEGGGGEASFHQVFRLAFLQVSIKNIFEKPPLSGTLSQLTFPALTLSLPSKIKQN